MFAVLGFLWMNGKQLGFDLTILKAEGRQYIEMERNGQLERLVIDKMTKWAPCTAGQAKIYWKAHREGDDFQTPLVFKDSLQFPERKEEGKLLREATDRGVVNIARYYHHETVRIGGHNNDIHENVRKGLDITKAANHRSNVRCFLQAQLGIASHGENKVTATQPGGSGPSAAVAAK